MKGNFDNREEHLAHLGPTRWSTEATAHRIARALFARTGRPWIVTLKMDGPSPGGFHVGPTEKRKRAGKMPPSDWQALAGLLGVIPIPEAPRYYILPDEVAHVLSVLEGDGPRPRRGRRPKADPLVDVVQEVG